MKILRITLIIQILFFLGWSGLEEYKIHKAPEILLETQPVDPRDLLSGHYMTLNYRISNISNVQGFDAVKDLYNREIFVLIGPEKEISVNEKKYTVYNAEKIVLNENEINNININQNQFWVSGIFRKRNVLYGIEKYYFSEKRKEELNKLRSGKFYVETFVGNDRKLKVKNLIFEK